MTNLKDIFISLIVIINDNDDDKKIKNNVEKYINLLKDNYTNYELLLLDNRFDSFNIEEILSTFQRIRYLKVSNKVSEVIALAASLENSIGDIIVLGNISNLTCKAILDFVDKCCSGNDIVIGCSKMLTYPIWYRLGSAIFRNMLGKLIGYKMPKYYTGLIVLSRRVANSIMSTSRFHSHFLTLLTRQGYKQISADYVLNKNSIKKISASHAFNKIISLIVFNSTTPLRVMNFIGLLGSFLAILIGCYGFIIKFLKDNVVEGWASLVIFMALQFFLIFLILSFLGEYVVRILTDNIDGNPYDIAFEKNSSVMLDIDRLNVLKQSDNKKINATQTGRNQ